MPLKNEAEPHGAVEMKKSELKKVGLAGGIATGLILLVVGFVAWQQPEPKEMPELSAPSLPAAASAKMVESASSPPTLPDAPPKAADPKAEAPKAEAKEKAKPVKKPPKKKKVRRRPRPVRKAAPRPRPAPDPEVIPVSAVAQRGAGFKVKFKNLGVLERLVDGDHVSLVLEYADGTRFLLPRELDGELIALHVPKKKFETWIQQRRVSELEPTPALMSRFKVHRSDVRYLAVLSADLRDIIAREADRARVNIDRSVMVIDSTQGRPLVSVLLPRK